MDALDKVITKVVGLPHKSLSRLVFGLGLVVCLYLLAQITWQFVPEPDTPKVPWTPSATNTAASRTAVNIEPILDLSLFGKHDATQATKTPEPEPALITDAPKSSLSIQLTGVVASTAKKKGLAIIASSGDQSTYSIGDKIKGTSASLKEVYADRIIITNAGRFETVMLDGLQFTTAVEANRALQQAARKKAQKKVNKISDPRITAQIAQTRQEILADPQKINDYLQISPLRRNGQVLGYRLSPGMKPSLFKAAGFKAGDIAKSLNGYDLTDVSQAFQAMAGLQDMKDISITVERQGQLIEIDFGLPN
ncbi:type II secretion system protein GspC [Parashewanella curva]|uniref:Type II secretion system protein GspC n=1 Tax=Parashewanella curva TaxID=2338552 RepID=A0A3L8PZ88_9GAMM|nr:type II secretion system protein GspC [Parashewanella curva]RLV60786.1 type II secretion system protein GspC [Parashewanella curva]